jgi:hypothetical protein
MLERSLFEEIQKSVVDKNEFISYILYINIMINKIMNNIHILSVKNLLAFLN